MEWVVGRVCVRRGVRWCLGRWAGGTFEVGWSAAGGGLG